MNQRATLVILWYGVLCTGLASGCGPSPAPTAPPEPPVIPVSHPVSREVTDYVDYTGQTAAVQSANITPRVTGYLVRMPFKEGADVKGPDFLGLATGTLGLLAPPFGGPWPAAAAVNPARAEGDLLFEIDPRPYEAAVNQARAQVAIAQAQRDYSRDVYERNLRLVKTLAVNQEELQQSLSNLQTSEAQLQAAQANLEVNQLNLGFTRVTSPIDGQVSRYYLTFGNLVTQDQTLLTTVVSLDPMYAYFYVDEPTLLRARRAVNEGRMQRPPDGVFPVFLGLQGEEGYPHAGVVNFVNNQVNPATGSLAVRGVFRNPKPPGGARLLSPGMFVRIRLPLGQPHPALLIIDRAVASDQGLKYVYVLDAENKAQYRRVTTGPLQEDGLRVIRDGLKPDDWVVVGGLQQVRPRMPLQPEQIAMPTLGTGTQETGAPR